MNKRAEHNNNNNNSRRKFLQSGGLGIASLLAFPSVGLSQTSTEFKGIIANDEDGETVMLRDGTALIRIKISKLQGSQTISFLSESFRPGDALPVHKHLNEEELIFIHKGSGLFTLGEKEYAISEGAVALVPSGVWHGLKNTGSQNIEMRFAYIPSGFEGFFREIGTPVGQPFVRKSLDERRAIGKKWGIIYRD